MCRHHPSPRGGRIRAACNLCRQKKIRCDGGKPACETCRLAGMKCIITPQDPSQKKPLLRDQLAKAQSRIQELEARLSTPQLTSGVRICDQGNFVEAMEVFKRHLACAGPVSANAPWKEAFLCTPHNRAGYTFDIDSFTASVAEEYNAKHAKRPSKALRPKWPAIGLIRQCIEHYESHHLYSIFPFVEPCDYKALVNKYATNLLPPTEHTVALALLAAFTAFMTQIHRHLPAFANAEPDCYILAALTLTPHVLMEPTSIEGLQAVVILAHYMTPTGNSESGQLLLGVAVRMLYNLGAHSMYPTHVNQQQHAHLRALFWACYAMDKEMSIRGSQPPLIHDEDCDLDLPLNYIHSTSEGQYSSELLSSNTLLYLSDLRLAMLKSKIYRLLTSSQAQAHPRPRRLEYIRQLDQELSELKARFPPHFQPDPTAYLRPDYRVHDLSLRGMNIHLEYYYCLRIIHEASIVSSTTYPGAPTPLESSVELYYHAVRSKLLYFIRAEGLIQAPTIWIHAQLILSSVIALFLDMIHNPAATTFHADLRILEQMRDLFARLCENCWETAPLAPLFIFEAFLGRLVGLVKGADG
ncbi:C6 transcription factor [Aspergillus desertorum]